MELPSIFTFANHVFVGGQSIVFHVEVDGIVRILKWTPAYFGKREREIYELLQREHVTNIPELVSWREGKLSLGDIFDEAQVPAILILIEDAVKSRHGAGMCCPAFDYKKRRFNYSYSTILLLEYMGETLNSDIAKPHYEEIINQLTPTLARLEELGIMHCDIHPGNITYRRNDDDTVTFTLIDFGSTRMWRESVPSYNELDNLRDALRYAVDV